jgi:hypothetical protein
MKTSLLTCLTAVALLVGLTSNHVQAQHGSADQGFGAGAIFGEPTGVNLKYWIDRRSAVDAIVGSSFDGRCNLYLQSQYLYHWFDVIDPGHDRIAIYAGGGARYQWLDHRSDRFGLRGVGGLTYLLHNAPVDIFVEVGPIFDLTPDRKVRFGGGIGARYWF